MYDERADFQLKSAFETLMLQKLQERAVPTGGISSWRALEVGGSGGILSAMMSRHLQHVICTDVVNEQVKYSGQFPKLIVEKCLRLGVELDLAKIEFHTVDAQKLMYRDGLFDMVFSLNAFEHIPNPVEALGEACRVLRHQGVLMISFDPIWTADSGSHFLHHFAEPWAHLLYSDEECVNKLRERGAPEFDIEEYLGGMNRKPISYYMGEFHDAVQNQFENVELKLVKGFVDPGFSKHPNFKRAMKKTGLTADQLSTRRIEIFATKR